MNRLERHLEDPVRLARIRRASYAVLAAIALAEILAPWLSDSGHPHFAFERFPAWGSLYGLLSCGLIVVVSKLLGKLWLSRREDHDGA